jgi:hypothetical protein
MRSFAYPASLWRTYSVSVAKLSHDEKQQKSWGYRNEMYILGKTDKLAGPHFNCVVIVSDVVVWLEAAMVEVLVLVDARIVVVGKAW